MIKLSPKSPYFGVFWRKKAKYSAPALQTRALFMKDLEDGDTMPRELTERDLSLLKKMAPECETITCTGSGLPFRSLIPPVSNHFSTSPEDFQRRIRNLSRDDLEYLLSLIREGQESLGCVPLDHISILIDKVAREIGAGSAAEVLEIYETSRACEE